MRWLRVAALAVTLSSSACEGEANRPPTVVRDSAGVTIVESDFRQPAWGREDAWHLSQPPLIQVGNVPGDETQQLYRVGHVIRLRDGSIAVANTGLSDVRIFDPNGYHLRTLMMPLVGVEVPRPLRLHELPGDTLLVFLDDRSFALFDATGAMVAKSPSLTALDESTSPPQMAGAFGDGTLLLRTWPPEDTTGTGVLRSNVRLHRVTSRGESVGVLGDFPDLTIIYGEDVYVFGATGAQATSDSSVWYGPGDRFELVELGFDGEPRRIVRLDRPMVGVTGADVAAFRKGAHDQLSATVGEGAADSVVATYQYAEFFPPYDQIIVDDGGNVWVRSYQWFDFNAGKEWTIFDPEGRHLGRIVTPPLLEPHHIGEDFVLGRMATGRGQEAVYLFRLEKPGTAPQGGQ